ncbi:MAG: hypothetical protein HZT40_18320 [Candidatus Thiothrix singaporensis]|uniref:Uncharacterized protein n=1 Tax=Candidatus Thiothrix singaporensis TaxID=2799669 RepID=A0A7L6AW48_9GAMM|nr:MAG: hypothetical protein HZT40_18320 [Candidatus Thiothrix singaporensis]
MDIADIDQDNHPEVIGLLSGAYIIDPDNNGLLRSSSETASSLAISTDALNGDPVVYVGSKTGVLSRLAADASLTPVNSLCDNDIVALEAISPVKLAFVCNGTLGIYDVVAGSVAWVTNQGFDGSLGNYDRLKVEKVNGKIQILVGGSSGYLFEELEAGSSDNILNIQVRGLLQGAYDAGLKLMHQRLAERQVLPLKQPYSDLFAYSGSETLALSFMGAGMMGNATVDWVLVELRDVDNPANRVFSSAAILQRDGDVAEPRSNLTTLAIPNIDAGAYYVSLRHRNHLGVMTAEPVTLSATPTLIDFSNPTTKVFGTHARKQVGSVSLMWSGDVNKDNNVIGAGSNNDTNSILSSVLTYPANKTANTNFILPGYYVSDLNMDGRTIQSG